MHLFYIIEKHNSITYSKTTEIQNYSSIFHAKNNVNTIAI